MLAMCIADGLTVGSRVYRKGEVFPATTDIADLLENSSPEQVARRQVKLYGRAFYRKATLEEMVAAYEEDKAIAKSMTDRERKLIAAFKLRKKQDAEDFMSHLDVNPEEIERMVNPPKEVLPEPEPEQEEIPEEAEILEEVGETERVTEEAPSGQAKVSSRKSYPSSGKKKTSK